MAWQPTVTRLLTLTPGIVAERVLGARGEAASGWRCENPVPTPAATSSRLTTSFGCLIIYSIKHLEER